MHEWAGVVKQWSGFGAVSYEGRSMGIVSVSLLSIALLAASPAPHGPPAPAAKPLSSDTAKMNVPFALDFFNIRIQKIEWMADTSAFAQKISANSDEGLGSLVITALVKANGSESANVPTPSSQAIFKDGSASNEVSLDPYTTTGKQSNATYQPGDGGTVIWVMQNVAAPTQDNPITKIVFKQSYTDLKPALIRLLSPPVTIVR